MKHKGAALALAGALALGVWQREEFPLPPLTTIFAHNAGGLRHERLPSLRAPADTQGLWCIRVGARPVIANGHHLFVEFAPMDDKAGEQGPGSRFQIHGIPIEPESGRFVPIKLWSLRTYWRQMRKEDVLKTVGVDHDWDLGSPGQRKTDLLVDLWYGSRDEALKKYLAAMTLIDTINRGRDQYDVERQNSNSIVRTVLDALGLKAPEQFDAVADNAGTLPGHIWTPGFDRCLLPQSWNRQVMRILAGYARLTGDRLVAAAEAVSRGEAGISPELEVGAGTGKASVERSMVF